MAVRPPPPGRPMSPAMLPAWRPARCARRSPPRWPKNTTCRPKRSATARDWRRSMVIPSRWETSPLEMKSQGQAPKAMYEYWAPETKPLGQGGDMHFAFSFAAQAAEVEVNTHHRRGACTARHLGQRCRADHQRARLERPGGRRRHDGPGECPDRTVSSSRTGTS